MHNTNETIDEIRTVHTHGVVGYGYGPIESARSYEPQIGVHMNPHKKKLFMAFHFVFFCTHLDYTISSI
jgi:hypothetical protein